MRAGLSPTFYRVAGIASFLSVVTTLMLIFLPQIFAPVAEGIPGRMQRVADPVYQLRAWAYQVHPFLVFTGCLGVATACRRVSPALALAGILSFGLWAITVPSGCAAHATARAPPSPTSRYPPPARSRHTR